ncbi:MAG: M20/M25/M40 family metallo-hydrolase [Bryobacteraceae bacterium]
MKKLLFAVLCLPLAWAQERVDLQAVNRIKAEALQNSKVMEYAAYMTDVLGPRLSGSPGYNRAAEWAMKQMKEIGLEAHLEKFPYGRGWANFKFAASMKEPFYQPLIGVPRPLAPGTGGPVAGQAELAVLRTEADLEKFKGKLKGKIVLLDDPRQTALSTEPISKRYTDQELANEALAPDPSQRFGFRRPTPPQIGGRPGQPYDREAAQRFRNKLNQFLKDEGVLATVTPSFRGEAGTVFASAAGSRDAKDPLPPPAVALNTEHYNQIVRLINRKVPVTLEFEMDNRIYDGAETANVIGELRGGAKKDEVVMLGAHLDSWTFGTGAADNAAGCAVMMEAVRILKALDITLPRTVRVGLWSAEEQGLLGSAAYVKDHYADRETMSLKSDHKKFSGYFNFDNGGGKIRGVYLQGNDMMRPIFTAWLEPFRDMGVTTVTIRNTSGTDHLSFDAVGLPGFQFIQDPLEYSTRTHHSNMDVYDRLQAGDLMQASAVIASLAYHAATRDQLLPRKPLPKPQPRRGAPSGR